MRKSNSNASSRLCLKLSYRVSGYPLDPREDLAFKVNFLQNSRKNTLYNDFLISGMDREHPLVKHYCSMKYAVNSPYGIEARMLAKESVSTKINLSSS
jgi:hypothetical protein